MSAPVTPNQVLPNEAQLLHMVLPINNPIVPEVVQLGPQVQRFAQVLADPHVVQQARPRRSTRSNIDYAKYNETGDKE